MYSVLVHCCSQTEKIQQGHTKTHTEKGNEKIQIDGQEKAEISAGQRWKRENDNEERDLERRLIHFYSSRTHYLLIRAHTFYSV